MHRLVSHHGCSPASLAVLFNHFLSCLCDTPLDGFHLGVFFLRNGCHVPNDSHLITWGLDTAMIGVLRCCEVERWSLGGVIRPRCPQQACQGLRCGLDLIGLACLVTE